MLGVLRPATAQDWAPNLTTTAAWNSNITNANLPADRIGALLVSADMLAGIHHNLSGSDSLHPGLHLAAEWAPRYRDLTTLSLGARGEWRHKFGLGALAPVFSVEAAGDFVSAHESNRRGTAYGVTVALRKRFNDTTRLTLSQEFSRLDARAAVYDRQSALTTIELGYDVTEVARLTFAAFYRDGDIVSYATPPRPDLVPLAPNRLTVDTFRHPLVVYSIDARTLGARAGLVRAFDESSAVVFTYEYRDTERGPLRYVNHLVSLALVHQF